MPWLDLEKFCFYQCVETDMFGLLALERWGWEGSHGWDDISWSVKQWQPQIGFIVSSDKREQHLPDNFQFDQQDTTSY